MKTAFKKTNQLKRGFTIVEIAVVLIILALLFVGAVPFIGRAQADARDDRRESDVAVIAAALERYYQDNGEYPRGEGSSKLNGYWSATADGSWRFLADKLVPKYIDELPTDPSADNSSIARAGGTAYEYYANTGSYCGAGRYQMYILVYNFERRVKENTFIGECIGTFEYSGASNYRVSRNNT